MRKKCTKLHVADLSTFHIRNIPFRSTKQFGGDIFVNGYAIVKMFAELGLYEHATTLAIRFAEINQKD